MASVPNSVSRLSVKKPKLYKYQPDRLEGSLRLFVSRADDPNYKKVCMLNAYEVTSFDIAKKVIAKKLGFGVHDGFKLFLLDNGAEIELLSEIRDGDKVVGEVQAIAIDDDDDDDNNEDDELQIEDENKENLVVEPR